MFYITDEQNMPGKGRTHCIERIANRILEQPQTAQAKSLLDQCLRVLNSFVPDNWPVNQDSAAFIVRVRQADSLGMKCDMLLVGETRRKKDWNNTSRLYHQIRTVLSPDQMSELGFERLRGLLGSYIPMPMAFAFGNRPDIVVFLDEPPASGYPVWINSGRFVESVSPSKFFKRIEGSTDIRKASEEFAEIHVLKPLTLMGPLEHPGSLWRFGYGGEMSPVTRVDPGYAPASFYSYPTTDGDEATMFTAVEEPGEGVEQERKYRATPEQLGDCLQLLHGANLNTGSVTWGVRAITRKTRPTRYFDTPTLLLRSYGARVSARQRDDGVFLTIKVPRYAVDTDPLEKDNIKLSVALDDVGPDDVRNGFDQFLNDSRWAAQSLPSLDAVRALIERMPRLIEVVQLEVTLDALELQHPTQGWVLVSIDRVKVLAEGGEAGEFCEIEFERRDDCPEKACDELCRWTAQKLKLIEQPPGSTKYERALAVLAGLPG